MKLKDLLDTISGGTKIIIYVGCIKLFSGKMSEVSKDWWNDNVAMYLVCDVIRVNTVDGYITISI